jgi:hypothetical protein
MSSVRILLLCVVALLFRGEADAATTLTVDSTADSGAGTLRQAIVDANGDPSEEPVTIEFAIGSGPQSIAPTSALPVITRPVVLDGTSQPGFDGVPLIEIRGDSAPAGTSGLVLSGHSGSEVRGLIVNRFATDNGVGGYGLIVETGSDQHVIAGNWFGVTGDGNTAAGNTRGGVWVRGSDVHVDGNVISGNILYGVLANAGTGLLVRGNYIGVGADGETPLGNGSGVFVLDFATDGTFGGDGEGDGNVISGNLGAQVAIGNDGASGHVVRGNRIGVDADGTAVVPGGSAGISINGAPDITIVDNVIGGQSSAAIQVVNVGSDSITIQGNRIGIDVSGAIALPVTRGIAVGFSASGSPSDVTIGGVEEGEGNVISNASGAALAVLGGFSGNVGAVTSPARVSIRGNSLFANMGLGIDLEGDGVTPNDAEDADDGANGLQNYPVVTEAEVSNAGTAVTGTLASTPSTTFVVDVYVSLDAHPSGFGEGVAFLGSTQVTTDAAGDGEFSIGLPVLFPGLIVTATASTLDGNTSEFSQAVEVTGDPNSPPATTTTTSSTTTSTTSTSSTTASSTTSSSTTSSSTTSSVIATSTTVTTSTSTTTTTIACAETGVPQVLCVLADVPSACDGITVPKRIARGIAGARKVIEKAGAAPAGRSRRLLKKGAGRLARMSVALRKAGARGKVASTCAAELATQLDTARGLALAIVAAP